MGGMGAAAALRAPTPASGAGSLPRASSLAARRVFGAAPRPGRVRRLGSRARACTRVRASGGGLFGALPSAADATRFASEVKSTELELSRGMWRAFDAGVASASDALARAGEASTSGVSVAATRAADAAARFLPESLRASLSDAAHAALAAIPPEVLDAAGDIPEHPALVAFFLVAALGGRSILPSPTTSGSAARGMDEWAALAAAEGDEEPIELQNYDPDAIYAHFKRRPLVLLRRGLRSGSLLGGYGFRLWLDRKILGEDPPEAKKAEVDAKRAIQLRNLLISLGPTYVKLGQVLSSRQDLLPAPYIKELRTLQDSVPPFDDDLAKRILAAELGPTGSRTVSYTHLTLPTKA